MIELNKETEEYAEKHGFRIPYDGSNKLYDDNDVKWSKEGFISEANSKYVKQQILLAKIDALRNIAGDDDEHTEKRRVLHITRFQQELKQLQDE